MEVARTSMICAAAPHFLWPFVDRYTTHQLNLWPCVSQVDPLPLAEPVEVTSDCGAAGRGAAWGTASRGAEPAGAEPGSAEPVRAEPGGAEPEGVESKGAEPRGVEPEGAESRGVELEGTESGGAELRGTASAGGPLGASSRRCRCREPLSPQQLREWFAWRTRLRSRAAGAVGPTAGSTIAGGAGAGGAGGLVVLLELEVLVVLALLVPEVLVLKVLELPELVVLQALELETLELEALELETVEQEALELEALELEALELAALKLEALELEKLALEVLELETLELEALWLEAMELEALELEVLALEMLELEALELAALELATLELEVLALGVLELVVLVQEAVCSGDRFRSAVAVRVPPASSLADGPDPESDLVRAANPTVTRLLASVVTNPSFESAATSAPVDELVEFAAACCLDYAASLVANSESICPPSVGGECALGTDVLEDRQEDFECFAAAVPHLVAMLLAPEGDPDARDIPTPRSYAEAITSL
ncbi:unnamed protein product [Closterium sp. NIES-65]|nr:unnamed protein product [Closterium sp. NIES-65]